jgi:hypothetical protein
MKHISATAHFLSVLLLLAFISGCNMNRQPPPTWAGNFRLTARNYVNGFPGYTTAGRWLRGWWVSGGSGGTTTLSGATDGEGFYYALDQRYTATWLFSQLTGTDPGECSGETNEEGYQYVNYKDTYVVPCYYTTGEFYSYNTSTYGYIATSVPDEWGDGSDTVKPSPGDPGTLPPLVSRDNSGSILYPDDYVESEDGSIRLLYQQDGNLVIYDVTTDPWTPLWATGTTNDSLGYVIMQDDGNLVLYDENDSPLWATGTDGNSGAYMVLTDTGDLLVLRSDGFALWWSASGDGGLTPSTRFLRSTSILRSRTRPPMLRTPMVLPR